MPSRSGPLAAIVACLLCLGLVACGSDEETVTETQVETVTEATTVTEVPEPTVERSGESKITPIEPVPSGQPSFKSPTGNIGCQLTAKSVRCDILEFDYARPPAPADCPVDYGDSITLKSTGPAFYTCHGDTAVDPGAPVLAYGDTATNGPFVCESSEEGVTCGIAETGQGFNLSRQTATLSPSS